MNKGFPTCCIYQGGAKQRRCQTTVISNTQKSLINICRGRRSCRRSVGKNKETRSASKDHTSSIAENRPLYHYAIF